MASKTKKETSSVKEKKPSFPSQPHPNNTIQRRRSLGPTAIPIPGSPDRTHKLIQQSLKPSRSLNTDPFIPKNPSKKLHTSTPVTDKPALQRRTSLDTTTSLSQLPKQLSPQNSREKKSHSSTPVKSKTPTTTTSSTSSLQRPATKDKSSKQTNTLSRVSKTNLTSPRLASERSSKVAGKEVQRPKNVKKTASTISPTSIGKQKNVTSTSGSTRKPRNTTTTTRNDESLVRADDYNVELQKETVHADESPVEVVILEDKGISDFGMDDHLLNQHDDNLIYFPHETEESLESDFEDMLFGEPSKMLTECEVMHYKQETNLEEDEDEDEDEEENEVESRETNEIVKAEADEEEGIIVNEGIQMEEQNMREEEEEEVKADTENVVVVSSMPKKDSPAYNDVIKETVNRLREQRKNRVRALVGAFETVISLEDPMADNSSTR